MNKKLRKKSLFVAVLRRPHLEFRRKLPRVVRLARKDQ